MKLGNHSIQWIIVVLIIVMTVCLSTLATLFFVEHYDAVRSRYYESLGYLRRQDLMAAEQAAATASAAQQVIGSKQQQAMAYSHNYSTLNDPLGGGGGLGKSSKKGMTNKSEAGGGGGVNGGQNSMQFPSLAEQQQQRSGTGLMTGNNFNNNLGVDPAAHLNWSNLEFSFLYIYKLQQYYNELQRKNSSNKGAKVPPMGDVAIGQGGGGAQAVAAAAGSGGDVMADSPSNVDDDPDSGEGVGGGAGDPAEDNITNGGGGGGMDLKVDEELLNRLLANILNVRNQSFTEPPTAAAVDEGNPVLVSDWRG